MSSLTRVSNDLRVNLTTGDKAYITVMFEGSRIKRVTCDDSGNSGTAKPDDQVWHTCSSSGAADHVPAGESRCLRAAKSNTNGRTLTLTCEFLDQANDTCTGNVPSDGYSTVTLQDTFRIHEFNALPKGVAAGAPVHQLSHWAIDVGGGDKIYITVVMQDDDFGRSKAEVAGETTPTTVNAEHGKKPKRKPRSKAARSRPRRSNG